MTPDDLKRLAAEAALALVEPGMRLGLGTGSTAKHFVDLLGERVKEGLDVICVPTSEATRAQATALGIRLTTLDETPELDLTVDGADELDKELRLIKGGGGALLREKIVAAASARLAIIADHTKKVPQLGRFPLPVEVVPFGHVATLNLMRDLAAESGAVGDIALRRTKSGEVFVTDNGNYIYDCSFKAIIDAELLDEALRMVPGVVENGLFLGLADVAFVALPEGLEVIEAESLEIDT